eukprot:SAG11_NODE_34732_length_270_cov_0.900585_1_plen_64_part_01
MTSLGFVGATQMLMPLVLRACRDNQQAIQVTNSYYRLGFECATAACLTLLAHARETFAAAFRSI